MVPTAQRNRENGFFWNTTEIFVGKCSIFNQTLFFFTNLLEGPTATYTCAKADEKDTILI